MSINHVVTVTISSDSGAVTRAGFGVPLVKGASNRWTTPERLRAYSESAPGAALAAMRADGFLVTDAEYLAASRLLSSGVRVPRVVVANAKTKPTQRWTLTPLVASLTKYRVRVDGVLAEYTSGVGATAGAIVAGLAAAIEALVGPAVSTVAGATAVDVVADVPGAFFAVETLDPGLLALEQTHPDPGLAVDLAECLDESRASEGAKEWYALVLCFPSTASVLAAAAWTEANQRFFLADTANTDVLTGTSATNLARKVKEFGYRRTAVLYHHAPGQFAAAGWAGRCLPLTPGTEKWDTMTVGGLEPSPGVARYAANLLANGANWYERVLGRNVTQGGGKTGSGVFVDVVRGIDELVARLQEDCFSQVADADERVPYNPPGFATMAGVVRARLKLTVGKLLAADPEPTVSFPRSMSEVDPVDRDTRALPISFEAWVSSAIQSVRIVGRVR